MENVLLRVTCVRSEMRCGEVSQGGGLRTAPGEIKFADGFQHPNIDGKSFLKSIGKEQNAVGDFGADAGESEQLGSGVL
jgi:hypothetical protein